MATVFDELQDAPTNGLFPILARTGTYELRKRKAIHLVPILAVHAPADLLKIARKLKKSGDATVVDACVLAAFVASRREGVAIPETAEALLGLRHTCAAHDTEGIDILVDALRALGEERALALLTKHAHAAYPVLHAFPDLWRSAVAGVGQQYTVTDESLTTPHPLVRAGEPVLPIVSAGVRLAESGGRAALLMIVLDVLEGVLARGARVAPEYAQLLSTWPRKVKMPPGTSSRIAAVVVAADLGRDEPGSATN